MSAARIDAAARILASRRPRRQVIGLLARTVLGGAAFIVTGSEARAQPGCRREGHPCEGNQTCCPGLTCAESEQGSARRCTAARASECVSDCPTVEAGVVAVGTDIDIEADCVYSGERQRTTCTFTAAAGEGTVASVIVPNAILCADVLGGDFEDVKLSASAQSTGNGLKSTRQEDGAAVVTVELDGEVTTATTATYWCETGQEELVPVTGPGLHCADDAEPDMAEASRDSGVVVIHSYTCTGVNAGADIAWFEVCQVMATPVTFQLTALHVEAETGMETQPTDADGICRFKRVPPGSYRLQEVDGDWCHAESDSVNELGDVVVKAAEVANVWVFHCAGAS